MANTRLIMISGIMLLSFAGQAGAQEEPVPTCADILGIDVHGQHIVGDYVTGLGSGNIDWPPNDADIGDTMRENRGVAVAGGPGPGFHFPDGVAPGASFCNDSESPGFHF